MASITHAIAALALVVFSTACSSRVTNPGDTTAVTDDGLAYFPGTTWRTANPRDVAMNEAPLNTLATRIRNGQIAELNGLVVVRRGYVVMEQYANGSSATHVHEMQSVTKSITSLLLGIAIDNGRIAGVDSKALGFFPEYTDFQNMTQAKRDVTLHQLLTMTSGLNFYEDPYPGSPLQRLNDSGGDWLRIIFDQPMNATPGERWQYNSGGVIALGGVIYNATGTVADEYARQHLFEPIGIRTSYWFKGSPNGLPHMGGGLGLRASDLARIGYLVLRKGKWGDTQIVSESWLRESTGHHVRAPRTFGSHSTDYGYLWWLLPLDNRAGGTWDTDIITASGAKGQWLFIVPKYDLVVAATSNGAGFSGYIDPIEFLYSYILPAVNQP
jgi:CubicO group peptidase (beta-lactamase class C family)